MTWVMFIFIVSQVHQFSCFSCILLVSLSRSFLSLSLCVDERRNIFFSLAVYLLMQLTTILLEQAIAIGTWRLSWPIVCNESNLVTVDNGGERETVTLMWPMKVLKETIKCNYTASLLHVTTDLASLNQVRRTRLARVDEKYATGRGRLSGRVFNLLLPPVMRDVSPASCLVISLIIWSSNLPVSCVNREHHSSYHHPSIIFKPDTVSNFIRHFLWTARSHQTKQRCNSFR